MRWLAQKMLKIFSSLCYTKFTTAKVWQENEEYFSEKPTNWSVLPEQSYEYGRFESFVCTGFSSSGTQDVSVAGWAPSNPVCPVAWYPRKLFWGIPVRFLVSGVIRPSVALLPVCPLSFLSLRKQAFSHRNDNVQPPCGAGLMLINKKSTAILLCFLVAGRRIELRTS